MWVPRPRPAVCSSAIQTPRRAGAGGVEGEVVGGGGGGEVVEVAGEGGVGDGGVEGGEVEGWKLARHIAFPGCVVHWIELSLTFGVAGT